MYEILPALLLPWYRENARDLPWRRDTEPYHVWISEIMLQQTRVEAVRGYYMRFLAELPDLAALAEASEQKLMKLWEGLGYYSRARNLHRAAKEIQARFGGIFPSRYEDIRSLPGIGPYTAGAIASVCFGQPRAAVDGNVLRVIARFSEDPSPVDRPQTRRRVEQALEAVYPPGACGDFTQALMELGATVCTPGAPDCARCPLSERCLACAHGTAASLPLRAPKKDKRVEERTVFLFVCEGRTALEKRGETGLLAGLWQFPNVAGALSAPEALQYARQLGLHPQELEWERRREHVFTHLIWKMTGYRIRCAEAPPQLTWASAAQLAGQYALPAAFRIFLDE